MQSYLDIWSVLFFGGSLLALAEPQAIGQVSASRAEIHPLKDIEATSRTPALAELRAEISGSVVNEEPQQAIHFVIALHNDGPTELRISDPLETLQLAFATLHDKPINIPIRASKTLIHTSQREMPYSAPIEFLRVVRGTNASRQKENVITIAPFGKVQIVFRCEPVVLERVIATLQSELGDARDSFKARVTLALVSPPPASDGRSVQSGWIFIALPRH